MNLKNHSGYLEQKQETFYYFGWVVFFQSSANVVILQRQRVSEKTANILNILKLKIVILMSSIYNEKPAFTKLADCTALALSTLHNYMFGVIISKLYAERN